MSFSSTLLDEIYRSIDDQTKFKSPNPACFQDDSACLMRKHQKPRRSAASSMRYERQLFCLNDNCCCGGGGGGGAESVYGVLIKPTKPIRSTISDEIVKQRIEETKSKHEGRLFVKTKSKALKIYSDLKQPISPGGRLATFLNSLFTNSTKKSNTSTSSTGGYTEAGRSHLDRKSKSAKCSSASRSCTPSSSRGKLSNGFKRSVRFYPVDEPCRSLHEEEEETNQNKLEVKLVNLSDDKNRNNNNNNISEAARRNLFQKKVESCEYEQDLDDGGSDSSSDLFELSVQQELPIYETTQLNTKPLFM